MASFAVNPEELIAAAAQSRLVADNMQTSAQAVSQIASAGASAAGNGALNAALDSFGGRWQRGLRNLESVSVKAAGNLAAAGHAFAQTEDANTAKGR